MKKAQSDKTPENATAPGSPVAFITTLLILFFTPALHAQSGGSYDLTWSSINGGGGTSTGGVYSVAGTIGQPDAGHSSGGSYSLDGGFIAAFQSPGGPLLTITVNRPQSTVTTSWPSPSTGFVLQESASLNPQNWITIPPTNSDNGTIKSIVLPVGPGNKFYRLMR